MEHVLFECDRYEKVGRDWKGILHHERESGIKCILGYKRMSEKLELVSLSMLGGMWRERELKENERELGISIDQGCFSIFSTSKICISSIFVSVLFQYYLFFILSVRIYFLFILFN